MSAVEQAAVRTLAAYRELHSELIAYRASVPGFVGDTRALARQIREARNGVRRSVATIRRERDRVLRGYRSS